MCEFASSNVALGVLLALALISFDHVTALFLQGGQRQLRANVHPKSRSLRTSEGPRMMIFAFDGLATTSSWGPSLRQGPRMQGLLGTQKSHDRVELACSIPNAVDVLLTTMPDERPASPDSLRHGTAPRVGDIIWLRYNEAGARFSAYFIGLTRVDRLKSRRGVSAEPAFPPSAQPEGYQD